MPALREDREPVLQLPVQGAQRGRPIGRIQQASRQRRPRDDRAKRVDGHVGCLVGGLNALCEVAFRRLTCGSGREDGGVLAGRAFRLGACRLGPPEDAGGERVQLLDLGCLGGELFFPAAGPGAVQATGEQGIGTLPFGVGLRPEPLGTLGPVLQDRPPLLFLEPERRQLFLGRCGCCPDRRVQAQVRGPRFLGVAVDVLNARGELCCPRFYGCCLLVGLRTLGHGVPDLFGEALRLFFQEQRSDVGVNLALVPDPDHHEILREPGQYVVHGAVGVGGDEHPSAVRGGRGRGGVGDLRDGPGLARAGRAEHHQ